MAVFTDRHGSSLPIATTILFLFTHNKPLPYEFFVRYDKLLLFYTSKKGHRLKATLRSNMEKLVTDIATNLIIANYFFFLSRISSSSFFLVYNKKATVIGSFS